MELPEFTSANPPQAKLWRPSERVLVRKLTTEATLRAARDNYCFKSNPPSSQEVEFDAFGQKRVQIYGAHSRVTACDAAACGTCGEIGKPINMRPHAEHAAKIYAKKSYF